MNISKVPYLTPTWAMASVPGWGIAAQSAPC